MVAPDNLLLAPKVRDLFFDGNGNWIPSRYKTMWGGRGGLKSWGFARTGVLLAATRKLRFLCGREFQSSIQESVHYTLKSQIEALNLGPYFDVQRNSIRSYLGSEFIFSGIRNNPKKIKSTEDVDVCWLEEAENVSEDSWQIITATIRKPGSEIWVGFNPDLKTDPTSQRFIESQPPRARVIQTSWRDNPWLSQELREEKDYLARVDPDAYAHVWEGGYRQNSAAQVLKGKLSIEAFEPQNDWGGPYHGADWGFAVDPSCLIRCWIKDRVLYIEYEAYGIGIEMEDLPRRFDVVPDARKYVVRADSARPETISYVRRNGYSRMEAAAKWTGCVEDGVEHLRSYEKIVIHPRCEHTVMEGRLWSYKQDKRTGDILPELIDKHNHTWDAVRYALEPLIKRRGSPKLTPLRM